MRPPLQSRIHGSGARIIQGAGFRFKTGDLGFRAQGLV